MNFVNYVSLLYIDLHSTKAQRQYAMKNHSQAVIKATQMNACMKVTNVQRDIYYMPWGVNYTVTRPPDIKLVFPLFYIAGEYDKCNLSGTPSP